MFRTVSPVTLEIFCHLSDEQVESFQPIFNFSDEYWLNLLCEYYPIFVPLKPQELTSKKWYDEVKSYTFDGGGLMKAIQNDRSAVVSMIMDKTNIMNDIKNNPQFKELARNLPSVEYIKKRRQKLEEEFANRIRSHEIMPEAKPFLFLIGFIVDTICKE